MRKLVCHPKEYLIRRWNWKSAILSSLVRALLFFLVNLSAGLPAAVTAMLKEFLLRSVTAGFYGSVTELFSTIRSRHKSMLAVMVALPLLNHSVEWIVHWMGGTPQLRNSILSSILFTILSSSFNLYAMQNGIMIVGRNRMSLWEDLCRFPRVFLSFILLPARSWKSQP